MSEIMADPESDVEVTEPEVTAPVVPEVTAPVEPAPPVKKPRKKREPLTGEKLEKARERAKHARECLKAKKTKASLPVVEEVPEVVVETIKEKVTKPKAPPKKRDRTPKAVRDAEEREKAKHIAELEMVQDILDNLDEDTDPAVVSKILKRLQKYDL